MGSKFEMKLTSQQDGFGFYYGEARRGDRKMRVDVLPPAALWHGDLKTVEPDASAWIVFFDGDEFARVEREADIAKLSLQVLLGGAVPKETVLERVRSGAWRLLGRH
jgi:hypothetical protein